MELTLDSISPVDYSEPWPWDHHDVNRWIDDEIVYCANRDRYNPLRLDEIDAGCHFACEQAVSQK